MIKVSVVIAAYNVEQYIVECIKSVINQTLKEIEILVIDDGSTDNTNDLANKLASYNNRIRVIRQENLGLSGARNTGAKLATGEFIYFLDGDDWIDHSMLEEMTKIAENVHADVVICDYKIRYTTKKITSTGGDLPNEFTGNKESILRLFLERKIIIAAWNKLFRRSFYERYNFQFPLGYLYEDIPLTQLICEASKIAKINTPFYNYRKRTDSIMGTLSDRMLGKLDLVMEIEEYLCRWKLYDRLRLQFQAFYIDLIIMQLINNCIMNGRQDPIKRDQLICQILGWTSSKKYMKTIWFNQYIPLKYKVASTVIKMNYKLYIWLVNSFMK